MCSIFESDSDYNSTASQVSIIQYKPKSVFFVREECLSLSMAEAFKECNADPNVNNQWIKAKDLLKWHQFRDELFVINCFNGISFNYLIESKAKVVGPLLLLKTYSDHSISRLFKTNCLKRNPINNKYMEKSFVCIEIKDQKRKQHLIQLIGFMSGVHCSRLTSIVTHLIIDSIQTKLHQKAVNYGIRVVTEEWVLKCWHDSQNQSITHLFNSFDANHQSIVEPFLVPLFRRLSGDHQIRLIEDMNPTKCDVRQTKRTKTMADNKDDGLDWIYFEGERQTTHSIESKEQIWFENKQIEDFHKEDTSDGLDWITFDTPLPIVDQQMIKSDDNCLNEVNDEEMTDLDDGLNWLYFDDNDSKVRPTLAADSGPEVNENEIKEKKRIKNEDKSVLSKNNEVFAVVWNYREFEGIPSQRPYIRI